MFYNIYKYQKKNVIGNVLSIVEKVPAHTHSKNYILPTWVEKVPAHAHSKNYILPIMQPKRRDHKFDPNVFYLSL